MLPHRQTSINFFFKTLHYQCAACGAKATVDNVPLRISHVVSGAMLVAYGMSSSGNGLYAVVGAGILYWVYHSGGRNNPPIDEHEIAGIVRAAAGGATMPAAAPQTAAPATSALYAGSASSPDVPAPARPVRAALATPSVVSKRGAFAVKIPAERQPRSSFGTRAR